MTLDTTGKKDTQKLQRLIVDALEDVKAQDIVVFNTEHLSPLFERVIIASGTSNRQTKALAASVRDAVRDAGFVKPRTEGEDNGEWIIVDCGAAVAHIMQPTIRTYYHLEEIWGDKPVRLKFGAPKPATAEAEPDKVLTKKEIAAKTSIRRSSAAKSAVKAAEQVEKEAKFALTAAKSGRVKRGTAAPARKRAGASAPAESNASKSTAKSASTPITKVVVRTSVNKAASKKVSADSPAPRRPVKSTAKRPAAKKAPRKA
jgi:ribosome-associated protein